MLQIAGGILIAYLAIITTWIWLPILLILIAIALVIAICMFAYFTVKEEPTIVLFAIIPLSIYIKNKIIELKHQKIVKRIGLLKYIYLKTLRFLRKGTKDIYVIKQPQPKIIHTNVIINILLFIGYLFICMSPVFLSIAFLHSEYEQIVLLLCLALSVAAMFSIFIKYPHKAFKKITRN